MLLVVAALLRVYAWLHTTAIFNDGPIFVYIAEAMRDGDWTAVLRHPYHPLYPLAVAGLGGWVADLERAAAIVSSSPRRSAAPGRASTANESPTIAVSSTK